MSDKNRPLIIFRYLWDHTDEEHPAIIKDILSYLETQGIRSNRKTVAKDLAELQDSGFDIIRTRSRQNRYFIGNRGLEPVELKTIIDAVQAARFISPAKSNSLIRRIASLGSPYQAQQLKYDLLTGNKIKTQNEGVYYTVDLLNHAIQNHKVVTFQYTEYTPNKEKILKHNGQRYCFSPYDFVWNNDAYYVLGWSEGNRHDRIVKFRVERIVRPKEIDAVFRERPNGYSAEKICRQTFSMYDGEVCTVTLQCVNSVMKDIIDRFGESVETKKWDEESFLAKIDVSVSKTFFAWVFTYAGQIRILRPQKVKEDFLRQVKAAQY